MNLKAKLLLIAILLTNIQLFAQDNYSLVGTVTDASNAPIPGANVVVQNTSRGVSTDFDGNFIIVVSTGEAVEFSYLGFKTQTIQINGQNNINVILAEDLNQLDEVVIIGYGTQKKSHLTGSISKVVNDDLEQIAVSRVDDALVGQVSGVQISATDGEAGSAPTIRIRGTGSITGDSSPLIVVDGVAVGNDFLGSLDMNDVESFEVLKDAASSAIFGSRGGNGVVMITTKQGKEGKVQFGYNTYVGFKEARRSDPYTFSVAETAAAQLAATGSLSNRTQYKQLIGVDRDWQEDIFDGGAIENHSFTARGGNEKVRFSTALNYLHDEGVLLTDDFKRYGAKIRIDADLTDKLSVGVSMTPSYTNRRRFDGGIHDIKRQPPWLPIFHDANTIQYVDRAIYPDVEIGDYAVQRHFDNYDLFGDGSALVDISNTSNTNPAAKVLERIRTDKKFKVFGSFYAKYDITDNLSFRTTFAADYQNTARSRWQGVEASSGGAANAQLNEQAQVSRHMVSDNVLSYNQTIGKHELSALIGVSGERWRDYYSTITGTGYSNDLARSLEAATTISNATSFEWERRLASYFGRVNYAYDDRYLASISVRRDGSSVFGPNNKFGNFPAASLGWNVSNESFLRESDVVNNLKFRFSYGVTGNDRLNTGNINGDVSTGSTNVSASNALIDSYPFLPLLSSVTAISNGAAASGLTPLNIANPDLKWERSVEINPGIDFAFFNSFISGSVDYYKRTSDQLLLSNPVSSTTGFTNALINIGEVENSGIEVELRIRNISTDKFRWNSTFIASHNKNELTDFADANGQIQSIDDKRAAEWINLEGNPISSYYGWVVDRDIPLEFINDPYHPVGGEAQDVYVKDLNGDGLIDDDDKAILGDPYPEFIWSVSNDFKMGDFDFSFLFQGSHGAEIRNIADQYIFNQFNSGQDFIAATTPDQGFIKQKIFTSDQIMDASYIALRTVNLGYNFPNKLLDKIGAVSSARLYVAGQNLMFLTADDYTGFNPESIDNTSGTTYGYQRGGSPVFRTISLGLNLSF